MDQRKPHVNTKIVDDLARSVDTSSTYTTYEIINMILRIFLRTFPLWCPLELFYLFCVVLDRLTKFM